MVQVFGSSFTVNGLGALLSCGLVGMGAGLSHSPVDEVRAGLYLRLQFVFCSV